jgi:hypothetical protein
MSDHRKLSNNAFYNLLNDIYTKGDGSAPSFGLTQAIIDLVKDMRNGMSDGIADQTAKKAASKASTTSLKIVRGGADDLVSDLKIAMRAAKVSADKFVEFGFDADDLVPSIITLSTPMDLVVQGYSNGTNELKFDRNGNKQGTTFLIEAKIGDALDYTIIGTTRKQSFKHTEQKPGVKTLYRTRAQRGDDFSEYSNVATVYE